MRVPFGDSRRKSALNRFTFEPVEMLEALADFGVEFVLVGGVAQGAHGSAFPTYDVDIAVPGGRPNLRRLGAALASLDAPAMRLDRGGLFETRAGVIDVTVFPPRDSSYKRLSSDAIEATVGRGEIRIASIDHLIAMREQRGRPYDPLLSLELRTLADEQRRQS